jgi:hypothetical protein
VEDFASKRRAGACQRPPSVVVVGKIFSRFLKVGFSKKKFDDDDRIAST